MFANRRYLSFFFFQAEDGIRDGHVTGVQTCALPISDDDLLSQARSPLSSALRRFTFLFEMEKGWGHLAMFVKRNGVLLFKQLGKKHNAYRVQSIRSIGIRRFVCAFKHEFSVRCCVAHNLSGYRIKPHGQLVLVSCVHCCTYTSSLSTSWSRTTLQGGQAPGIPHLRTSFPLRCLQRLSLPHIATRQCHWRDNRYTRGASTPVLSY